MKEVFDWILQIYALLAIIPFLSFLLLWLLHYAFKRDKKKATALAMDITTFLLMGSVSVMYDRIFKGVGGFWIILLLFLIAAGLIGGVQNRLKGAVDVRKLIRVVWRFGFLFLSLFYVLFLFIGIGKSMLTQM